MLEQPKTDAATEEARTLILASLILFGFQYRAGFEPGMDQLPPVFASLVLVSMGLMLVALGLFAMPALHHRIALRGADSRHRTNVAANALSFALIPFAASLGILIAVAAVRVAGVAPGVLIGAAASSVALVSWYAFGLCGPAKAPPLVSFPVLERLTRIAIEPRGDTPGVDNKIAQVLAEIRIILPGTQALLGFQFSVTLMQGFESVPAVGKAVYLWSLSLVAAATILLMAPAAWHRIVERGQDTERFHRFAGRALLGAMGVLALALTGDIWVVVQRVTGSWETASAASGLLFLFFGIMWFLLPVLRRRTMPGREAVLEPRWVRR